MQTKIAACNDHGEFVMTVTTVEKKDVPVQVFQEMERRDENQIVAETIAEMKSEEFIAEYVYDIQIEGRRVTNLSIQGTREAIRRRGKYEILDVHVEEDTEQFRCLVKVRDLIRQIDVLGASTCEKKKPFAYTLAVNKAERNAFRKLLPEKLIAAMIKEFLERKKPKIVVGVAPEIRTTATPDSPVPSGPSPSQPTKVPSPAAIHPVQESRPIPVTQPAPNPQATGSPAQEQPPLTQIKPETPTRTAQNIPRDSSAWTVPKTKDQALPFHIEQGMRQYQLLKGTQSLGMLNVLRNEISIVPERAIDPSSPPIHWFIHGSASRKGVVGALCAKHNWKWEVQLDQNGSLDAIMIRGEAVEQKQIDELVTGATWAFHAALEPEQGKAD